MSAEVVIVGGGMVGSTLACALAEADWKVTLVEMRAGTAKLPRRRFAPRVSAVSPASASILDAVGVWRRLDPARIGVYREMRVWRPGRGEIGFSAADLGLGALGWIVENDAIERALEERLAELDSVRWVRPARVEALTLGERGVTLEAGGERLRAGLVVGADGGNSRIRELAGLRTWRYDYGQSALVTTVRPEHGHGETAWQNFLDDGPLAFLPLPGGWCSIVWSTATDHAEELLEMDRESFEHAVARGLDGRLGAVECPDRRLLFKLRRIHAREYVTRRVALIGDAAHAIHPLAGQGVNLGFLDAAMLAEVMIAAVARGRDPAAYATLRRYERARKGHNLAIGEAMSVLRWGFGYPGLRSIAGLGLALVDRAPLAKLAFARTAAGLAGDLPRMAAQAATIDFPRARDDG